MRLPYPGLRPFHQEESDLFFGREECLDTMVTRLGATRFLAVLGSSGTGKSSLVNTGLLDALELGYLTRAGTRWTTMQMRPGGQPIQNLARALLRAKSANDKAIEQIDIDLLSGYLRGGPLSIAKWCRSEGLGETSSLLILVDQFEELFRYGDYAGREQAEAFTALLLESSQQTEIPIYVVITMRSEFLGACALIPGLAERINEGLYLTPRMTREQIRAAIEGPAAVCGFSIEPALVNYLLNDLSSFAPWEDDKSGDQLQRLARRADQLPLMQHVLNRLWSRASEGASDKSTQLTLADYERIGKLRGALDAHAREIFDSLQDGDKPFVEPMFRALITGSSVSTAVRRPCRFDELVALTGADRDIVARNLDAFRAPGCNFLVPPQDVALQDDTIIDISHESLIRQWTWLSDWLEKEARGAATWRRLLTAAEAREAGEGGFLGGLDLANFESWWEREAPNAAWAARYGGRFAEVKRNLERCRAEENARGDAEAARQREIYRLRRNLLIACAAALLVAFTLGGFNWYQALQDRKEALAREVKYSTMFDDLQATIRKACSAPPLSPEICNKAGLRAVAAKAQQQGAAGRQRIASLSSVLGLPTEGSDAANSQARLAQVLINSRAELQSSTAPALTSIPIFRKPAPAICSEKISAANGAQLSLPQMEARFEQARLAFRSKSAGDATLLLRDIMARLSLNQARTDRGGQYHLLYVKTASFLGGLYSQLDCDDKAKSLLADAAKVLPGMNDDLKKLSPEMLDAYSWYLSYERDFVPWTEATRFREQIVRRFVDASILLARYRPNDAEPQYTLSIAYQNLRSTLSQLKDNAGAEQAALLAIGAAQSAVTLLPGKSQYAINLSNAYGDQATFFLGSGKFALAITAANRAIAILDQISDPQAAARVAKDKADVLDTLAQIFGYQKQYGEALTRAQEAVDLSMARLSVDPGNGSLASDVLTRFGNLTWILENQGTKTQRRDICLSVATEALRLSRLRPQVQEHVRLVAAAASCAITAVGVSSPLTDPDVAPLDSFLQRNAKDLIAAFEASQVNPLDDAEFYENLGRSLQRLQKASAMRGDYKFAESTANTLIKVLSRLRPNLDYDIYTMGMLTFAYQGLAQYRLAQKDPQGAAKYLRLCANPDAVPYPAIECMRSIVDLIESGALGSGHMPEAKQISELIPKYKLEKFTIPIFANPGAPKIPFDVYVTTPPKPYKGIDNTVQWLKLAKGLEMPSDVADSFRKLDDIARKNNVAFPALAVYALGANESAAEDPVFKAIRQKFAANDRSGGLAMASAFYRAAKTGDRPNWQRRADVVDVLREIALSASNDQKSTAARQIRDVIVDLSTADLGNPSSTKLRIVVAQMFEELARSRSVADDYAGAKDNMLKAVALRVAAIDADPANAGCKCYLASDYISLVDIVISQGQQALAGDYLLQAIDYRRKALADEPENSAGRDNLVLALRAYAIFLHREGRDLEALAPSAEAATMAKGRFIATGTKSDLDVYLQCASELSTIADAAKHPELSVTSQRAQISILGSIGKDWKAAYQPKLISALGELSWYALFTHQWPTARDAADEALQLDPKLFWLRTNAAHARMFAGDDVGARNIYHSLRCEKIKQNDDKAWKDIVLEDFGIFRARGLPQPQLMREISAEFLKIKCS